MRLPALIGSVIVAAAVACGAARAEENVQLIEQKIKAGLIYNFLKYTQWPRSAPTAPLVVCLFGGDPFDGNLQPMAGRTVNQRAIEIRAISDNATAASCALLVLADAKREDWASLKGALAGKTVLTVSGIDGFAGNGGMIEFIRADNRIGIKLNTVAVAAAHLEIQDRLLKLASAVPTGG